MINLYDILDAADGQLFGEPAAQIFSGFCIDHRKVQQGDLFVALKTDSGDGHHYMEAAVKGGAIGIMCTHPPTFDTSGVTVMIMRDVEAALIRWSKYVLTKYGTTVIAVTGSNGKSTARTAIATVLSAKYKVYNGEASSPGRFALPLSLGGLNSLHQIAVLEFDPSEAGDMNGMIDIAHPTVAVLTNIAPHNAELMSAEARPLFESLPPDGVALLNLDEPLTQQIQTPATRFTVSVDLQGTSFGADLTAYNVVVSLDKTGFDLRYGNQRLIAKWVPLLGAHQLYAVLLGLAGGLSFGISLEEGLQALTEIEPLPGRMRALEGLNGAMLIDDSFNANPESVRRALDWIAAVTPRPSARDTLVGEISPNARIYVVLGDVTDQEANRALSNQQIGRRLAEVATSIITVGEGAASAARSAIDYGFPASATHVTFSITDAISTIKPQLGYKDVVLVKGNSSARMERIVAALLGDPTDQIYLPRQEIVDGSAVEENPTRPTYLNIDMSAIADNVRLLKQSIGADCKLMAVVKADAYGHGLVPTSTTAVLNGADALGVAAIEEAVKLREGGITASILVMGYTPVYAIRQALQHDIAISLYDLSLAKACHRIAADQDKVLRVHVRVDTGIYGIGLLPEDVPGFFRGLGKLEHLKIEGIYTHIDSGRTDRETMDQQLIRFQEVVGMLRAVEYNFEHIHTTGSTGTLHFPESRMSMVRCGLALYGLQSDSDHPLPKEFRPALSWKTSVVQVKRVSAGTLVGMGGVLTATKALTLAVLPVGFMDGFRRDPKHWGEVLVKGQRAPIFGQVGMYQTLIDVSQIDDVRVGDEVVLIGQQDDQNIRLEDVAERLGVSIYEIVSLLMPRNGH